MTKPPDKNWHFRTRRSPLETLENFEKTREIETKEQTTREELEFQNQEQSARNRLQNFKGVKTLRKQGAICSKETRELQKKGEKTARKRLENLEGDFRI